MVAKIWATRELGEAELRVCANMGCMKKEREVTEVKIINARTTKEIYSKK